MRIALTFQTVNRFDELLGLRKGIGSVSLTLDGMTKFLSAAIPVVAGQTAAWKSDQESLMLVAQYPLARRVIRSMLPQGGELSAGALPYERRTAATYLRIYGSEDKDVKFDEEKEVLVRSA